MFHFDWPECLVVGLIALLLFGKRLPEVARTLGRSVQELRDRLQHAAYQRRPRDDATDRQLEEFLLALIVGIVLFVVLLAVVRSLFG